MRPRSPRCKHDGMHPLRARRKHAGLSITELAARVGLSHSQLAAIELGKSRMRVEEMIALAAELGCELAEIIPPDLLRKAPDSVA